MGCDFLHQTTSRTLQIVPLVSSGTQILVRKIIESESFGKGENCSLNSLLCDRDFRTEKKKLPAIIFIGQSSGTHFQICPVV